MKMRKEIKNLKFKFFSHFSRQSTRVEVFLCVLFVRVRNVKKFTRETKNSKILNLCKIIIVWNKFPGKSNSPHKIGEFQVATLKFKLKLLTKLQERHFQQRFILFKHFPHVLVVWAFLTPRHRHTTTSYRSKIIISNIIRDRKSFFVNKFASARRKSLQP